MSIRTLVTRIVPFFFILLIRYVLSVPKDCNKRVTIEQAFVTDWLQVCDKE